MKSIREDVRNIAIIAHVDHGKTTLVDVMLRQSGIFRDNEKVEERVMDSNDLEKERGITILSKNTAVTYNNIKINIVDTPGHSDFGGEVERILKMVDGVLLLVDAFEGPMPQTRFVLKKALALNLKPIVVINKIDRPEARPTEVVDKVLDLFIELDANDAQLEFPIVYASSKEGYAISNLNETSQDLKCLFEAILENVPAPQGSIDESLQILISSIDYDNYVGRIGIGKVERGEISTGQPAVICRKDGSLENIRINKLYTFEGLKRTDCDMAKAGDIVCVSGVGQINIGETICNIENPEPIEFIDIDEPTITMNFSVNNSPFAGKEGTFVTSRHVRERLLKELETNVSLRVEETDSPDTLKVSGRGELHLSILIETMRRQGYEFQVSKPTVIIKKIDDIDHEPIEILTIDVPEEFVGVVIENLGIRKAELINMCAGNQGYTRIEFKIPSRGIIGYRNEFLTNTKGTGIMNSIFDGFEPFRGEISSRQRGSMVAWENGEAVTYGLYNAQERGNLFITPGTMVYEGMIVGENARNEDIVINVCKKKHVTNMRASGSDEALRLSPPIVMSLEQCLEFIEDDELVEVTPKSIRLRKKILDSEQRAKSQSRKNKV